MQRVQLLNQRRPSWIAALARAALIAGLWTVAVGAPWAALTWTADRWRSLPPTPDILAGRTRCEQALAARRAQTARAQPVASAMTPGIWTADGFALTPDPNPSPPIRTPSPCWTRAADLPGDLVAAFLAVEDDQFFSHSGVNPRAIGRAAYLNARARRTVQGGSTITQQVAKMYTGDARTLTRKLDEALLARRIERDYTKADILEAYLNRIYLGANAYGVTLAARRYFQKDLADLTLTEAALIAGLAVAPSRLNPWRHPAAALARRDVVLHRMARLHLIDNITLTEALASPLNLVAAPPPPPPAPPTHSPPPLAPDVAALTRAALRARWPHLDPNGFSVQVQVHLDHQQAARHLLHQQSLTLAIARGDSARLLHLTPSARDRVAAASLNPSIIPPILTPGTPYPAIVLDPPTHAAVGPHRLRLHPSPSLPSPSPDDLILLTPRRATLARLDADADADPYPLTTLQGAFAALDLHTGALLAIVGSVDLGLSVFNRATRACRPPGSVFKVVPFALALSRGFTPATVLSDAPLTLTDRRGRPIWTPRNADRDHRGPILLAQAFASSRNIPAIELVMRLSPQAVAGFARRLGLRAHPLRPSYALALGSDCVQPLEMISSYGAFARGGVPLTPSLLRMVWHASSPQPLLDEGAANDPLISLDLRLIRALSAAPAEGISSPDQTNDQTDPDAFGVISVDVAYQMLTLLRRVVTHGTAQAARSPDLPLAGKTGTTGLFDIWFIGLSPDVLAGVWLGDDLNRAPLGPKVSGGDHALPPWLTWMQTFSPRAADFPPPPPSVSLIPIDPTTGLLAHPQGPQIVLPFSPHSAPTRVAPSPTRRQSEQSEHIEREF